MRDAFKPTHRITLDGGREIYVCLIDGCAYTQEEADSLSDPDYERADDGTWTFQGQPFNGTVEVL